LGRGRFVAGPGKPSLWLAKEEGATVANEFNGEAHTLRAGTIELGPTTEARGAPVLGASETTLGAKSMFRAGRRG
jgi:hypothetical protein